MASSYIEKCLREQDNRWEAVCGMIEKARESVRLKIPYDQRPADLFQNLQDALYAIRGRTSLDEMLNAAARNTQEEST